MSLCVRLWLECACHDEVSTHLQINASKRPYPLPGAGVFLICRTRGVNMLPTVQLNDQTAGAPIYRVQYSSDLEAWTELNNIGFEPLGCGLYQTVVPSYGSHSAYYRIAKLEEGTTEPADALSQTDPLQGNYTFGASSIR